MMVFRPIVTYGVHLSMNYPITRIGLLVGIDL